MDWENHILAGEGCLALARAFVPFAGEEFLVAFANKGLYKRALKDCEAVEAFVLEARGEALTVTLDEVCVTLSTSIAKSVCSCPSKAVCKHILMAVLCAAEYAAQAPQVRESELGEPTAAAAEPTSAAPFAALRGASLAALRKQAGKRLFEDTLRLVQEGWSASFSEGELLAAAINTEDIVVYFPREDSVNRAVCKCGTQGLCRHKLVAILSYLSLNGLLDGVQEQEETALLGDALLELLRTADDFLVDVMVKGVVCAGENDVTAAAQLSVRLDAQGAGNLSRAFRRLSADFENLLEKNAAFSQLEVFAALSRLHNTVTLLLRSPGDSALVVSLIEGNRSEYYTTPSGTFTGLGAYPWQTRSGYFGITAFLYHHEKQRVCAYTVSMAGFYERTAGYSSMQSLKAMFTRGEHWDSQLSLETISASRMTLGNYKSNFLNRLSSGKQTVCSLRERTRPADVRELPCAAEPGGAAPPEPEPYAYFSKKRPEEVVAVRAVGIVRMEFDRVDQVLRFGLLGADGASADAELAFSELNEPAIRYLERLGKKGEFSERYFICLRRRALVPVSVVGEGGVENFYFI